MSQRFSTSDPHRFSKIGGREEQQDCCDYFIAEHLGCGCWVMADGLGGHAGGAVAAQLAVGSILKSFAQGLEVSGQALLEYMENAQQAILAAQESNHKLMSMRTTVVTLLLSPELAVWGHIGDSRLYHFQQNKIAAITKDHSVTQALVDSGKINKEDMRFDPNRNRLFRCMGDPKEFSPTIKELSYNVNDRFLLCTDGFWEHVWEDEMEADLMKAEIPDHWLVSLENRLGFRVKGKFDNHSALAIFLKGIE